MTSRGARYWDSGSIPLIGPDILGGIIATLADLAVVISSDGVVLSVLANPIHRGYTDLRRWERSNMRAFLTRESVPKFERALEAFQAGDAAARPVELNHFDQDSRWEFPINYTLHRIGPDDAILMLGRDLRPIAEMQQQLVKAQLALEKDYESQREYDTRFQVLLGHVADAVVFVSVGAGRITELNEVAARYLGRPREALMGRPFAQEFDGRRQGELIEQLSSAAGAGREAGAGGVTLVASRTQASLRALPVLFRAAGERMLLCRLEPSDGAAQVVDRHARDLAVLFEMGADAVVMTDAAGSITSANEAFLNLVDGTDLQSVRGRPLSDFLARGVVDQKVLTENAARAGKVRLYGTRIVGEYGAQRPVSVATTHLADREPPGFAFVMRDASVAEAVQSSAPSMAEASAQPLTELVGSTTMKDIVAQTTDVIEKMCIETAIELTGNNRVAAAEMLGLSRQSLYVKLRKYGLLNKDD